MTDWQIRLMLLMRAIVLWCQSLRHLPKLLRLGRCNGLALWKLQQHAGVYDVTSWWESWKIPFLIPVNDFAKTMWVFPSILDKADRKKTEQLRQLHRRLLEQCTNDHSLRKLPSFNSSKAIRLQVLGMRGAFLKLLGVSIDESTLQELGHYGCISCTIREFLEFCGVNGTTLGTLPLQMLLPIFALEKGLPFHVRREHGFNSKHSIFGKSFLYLWRICRASETALYRSHQIHLREQVSLEIGRFAWVRLEKIITEKEDSALSDLALDMFRKAGRQVATICMRYPNIDKTILKQTIDQLYCNLAETSKKRP